jgi:hypothetical protein
MVRVADSKSPDRICRMKSPDLSLVAVFLLLGLLGSSVAQTPALGLASNPSGEKSADEAKLEAAREEARLQKRREAKWTVTVDVQMVDVPQKQALQLLPALRSGDATKVEGALAQIQQLISTGAATLVGWPMVTMLDGERGVVETIVEERYPTEFGPPQSPEKRFQKDEKPVEFDLAPTAFETRNTGTTLEVESMVLGGGKNILINVVPQRVLLANMKNFHTGKAKDGGVVNIDQPIFHTVKLTSEQIVQNGRPALIAVHVLPTPEHPVEFFIARAVATKID